MLLSKFKPIAQSILSIFFVFLVVQAVAQRNPSYELGKIEVTTEKNDRDKSIDFYFTSKYYGSATILIEFEKLDNAIHYSKPVVVQGSSGKLFTLKPTILNRPISFRYGFTFAQGALKSKVNQNFVYALPFKNSHKFKAFELKKIATDSLASRLTKNWKAYTFEAKPVDSIMAVRKGIVIDINKGNLHSSFSTLANNKNSVWVEHKDGTIAEYTGFDREQIFVKEGQKIFPQSALGMLGNEGKLYFRIHYLAELVMEKQQRDFARMECITPVFATSNGNQALQSGEIYTVKIDEALITEEMTKREKKKKAKNK